MARKHISSGSCYRLPQNFARYPWLVCQNLEAKDKIGVQTFYSINDCGPLYRYRCRIPELHGRRIRGYYHSWVILSKNDMWSLWNPITSKIIRLPPLVLKDGDNDSIKECCLLYDPSLMLVLTTMEKHTLFICQLDFGKKRLRWKKISYAKQLTRTGDNDFLRCSTCFRGKLYALHSENHNVIQIDIEFLDTQAFVKLLTFAERPFPSRYHRSDLYPFLKGTSTDLFYFFVGFDEVAKKTISVVFLYKLNMTSMMWEEMEDLKDAIFFLDFRCEGSLFYNPSVATELGGYIHILDDMGKEIHSYNVKDKTVSLSPFPGLVATTHVSLLECRLQGDDGEIKCKKQEDDIVDNTRIERHDENIESHLLDIPSDLLMTIMEFCLGVEYLKFRATCKKCHLAAPIIQCSHESAIRRSRLQKYSLGSPWLMEFDKNKGIITFIDPMFGDKYFTKTPRELVGYMRIHYSMYGWLLIHIHMGSLMFFNPFTSEIQELPHAPCLETFCFSGPPTSPDCMVVGLGECESYGFNVLIHFVAREPSWLQISLNFLNGDPYSFRFPTFHGKDLYTLVNDGGIDVFRDIREEDYSWGQVLAEAPKGKGDCCTSLAQYFLVKCDQHLLQVIVGDTGKSIEVFKLNDSKCEEINGLGRHTIFICGTMCLCIEAKTREMENKIYFPLHSKNGKIVFYSFETRMYHTFNGRNIEESFPDFYGTKHSIRPRAWVEPSWC